MIVVHNLLALPILILVWICDCYLLFILVRVIAKLPSLYNTALAKAGRDLSDPLGRCVARGLAGLHPRAASPRITCLTSAVVLVVLRYSLLWLVVTVFSSPYRQGASIMSEPANHEPRNRPVATYRAGPVSASVWSNTTTTDSGESAERLSVSIQKRIQDPQTKEYRTVQSYFDRDLPRLQMVAQKAFEFIVLRSEENGQESAA